ncbi:hypothetical protein [Streptomyces sp. WAC 04229]|uniref:hypothetical protein n=1 Tax=Streptomyces sp. WAC 04229 TaxID=2203206 RepID=UPI00163CCA28|nr:hypothetical protein [Streptomyces sp. WAC 04229]
MEGDPPWWAIFVISAGVTVVLGAIFLSVVAAVALSVLWVRGRFRRRSSSGHVSR